MLLSTVAFRFFTFRKLPLGFFAAFDRLILQTPLIFDQTLQVSTDKREPASPSSFGPQHDSVSRRALWWRKRGQVFGDFWVFIFHWVISASASKQAANFARSHIRHSCARCWCLALLSGLFSYFLTKICLKFRNADVPTGSVDLAGGAAIASGPGAIVGVIRDGVLTTRNRLVLLLTISILDQISNLEFVILSVCQV